MFSFPELFKLLNFWDVVGEMINTATEGAREFGLARIGIVLASYAEEAIVRRLIAIAWFAPSLIILGGEGVDHLCHLDGCYFTCHLGSYVYCQ